MCITFNIAIILGLQNPNVRWWYSPGKGSQVRINLSFHFMSKIIVLAPETYNYNDAAAACWRAT